jgi:hypothetical protein
MLIADGNALEQGQQGSMADTGVDDFGDRIELLTAENLSCEVCGLQGWPTWCTSCGGVKGRGVE